MSKENINCIIVHGCPSDVEKAMDPKRRTHDKHWIPWVKEQLISKGIPTEAPLMPTPWQPDYEKFKKEFEKYPVNEKSVLIGHSCGCAFLVRWLGDSKQEIYKLILVAPWKVNDRGDEYREAFYTYSIDPSIKDRVKEIVMFTANDEKEEGKRSLEMYQSVLGGKEIELLGRGHYIEEHMRTTEFPELLEAILN